MIHLTKAVIPAAGFGTRMQSLTKGLPKELLPLGSKPVIQHALEMHIRSGVQEIAVIIHPEKEILREFLEGKPLPSYCGVNPISHDFCALLKNASLRFFYQYERRGVVDAVLLAREFIGEHWFSLIMPDCVLVSDHPFLAQIVESATSGADGVIGFILLEKGRAEQFGNVGLLTVSHLRGAFYRISDLSDKRSGAVQFHGRVRAKGFGGGIYSPAYFDYVPYLMQKKGPEVDDVPIHQAMAARGKLYGVKLRGTAFDVGNPKGYRAAQEFISKKEREADS